MEVDEEETAIELVCVASPHVYDTAMYGGAVDSSTGKRMHRSGNERSWEGRRRRSRIEVVGERSGV